MPLDYQLASSLVRIKTASSPGDFADDPNVAVVGEQPEVLVTDDPATTFAWRMPGRSIRWKLKLKVTFRTNDGTEVAGTFNAYAFGVVPLHPVEKALGASAKAAIEKYGDVVGSSAVPMVLDDLSSSDIIGVRLSSIIAVGATRAFIRCEEVS